MPDVILGRAVMLKESSPLHKMDEVMEKLNAQSRRMDEEKEEVDHQLQQAEKLHQQLTLERDNLFRKKDSILDKARQEAENMKRDLRVQSESIIKELKKNAADLSREQLGMRISSVRGKINQLSIPSKNNRHNPLPVDKIKTGQWVYIDTIDSEGVIVSVNRNAVSVECGMLHVKVTRNHLFEADKPLKAKKTIAPPLKSKHIAASVETIHTNLNIIGKTVDEAIPEVDRFLNDCFMAGISPVQIIHGKGTGKLRRGIQDYLSSLNFVREYHEADPTNGGAGVTEVYF